MALAVCRENYFLTKGSGNKKRMASKVISMNLWVFYTCLDDTDFLKWGIFLVGLDFLNL